MLFHPHSFLFEGSDLHVCLWKSLLPTFMILREGGGFISNLPLSSFISLSFSFLLQNSLVPSLSARPSILWSGETLCPHSFLWGIQFLNVFWKSVIAPFIVLPFHLLGFQNFLYLPSVLRHWVFWLPIARCSCAIPHYFLPSTLKRGGSLPSFIAHWRGLISMNLVKTPSYIGLEFHTFMKTLLCPHSCLSERIVFPVLFQKSLLPSIIVLSFHTLKGWALVFFHSFLGAFWGNSFPNVFFKCFIPFKNDFFIYKNLLPSFSALSFHTLWENANEPSVIPLWLFLFRRLFYHYPSFLNHSIHSVLLGRTGVSCQLPFFILPCPVLRYFSGDEFLDILAKHSSPLSFHTLKRGGFVYFPCKILVYLHLFVSEGFGFAIFFQRSLLPSLLCSFIPNL